MCFLYCLTFVTKGGEGGVVGVNTSRLSWEKHLVSMEWNSKTMVNHDPNWWVRGA